MLHPMRFSAARMAGTLALAGLAGFALLACGGGGGGGADFTPSDNVQDQVQACTTTSPSGLRVTPLQTGSQSICAETAVTPQQRSQGLSNRHELAANAGMLFVYPEPGIRCMWMEGTTIPLSVAFINQGGVIVNIENMSPLSTNLHCSTAPALYALEMNQGWFAQNNIPPGSRISGLP